jgi:hypothetical protein
VLEESLHIDFRGLAAPGFSPVRHELQPVIVHTRYRLRSDATHATLPLDVISSGAHDARLTLDGSVLSAASGPTADGAVRRQRYDVPLSSGEHTLELARSVAPSMAIRANLVSYAVDVELAPARAFASFGPIALSVTLPDGFELITAPRALREAGPGAFAASLPGPFAVAHAHHGDEPLVRIPPDALRVHVTPQRLWHLAATVAWNIGCALGPLSVLLVALVCWRKGRRNPDQRAQLWLRGATGAALCGFGAPLTGYLAVSSQSPHFAQPVIYVLPTLLNLAASVGLWTVTGVTALVHARNRARTGGEGARRERA